MSPSDLLRDGTGTTTPEAAVVDDDELHVASDEQVVSHSPELRPPVGTGA